MSVSRLNGYQTTSIDVVDGLVGRRASATSIEENLCAAVAPAAVIVNCSMQWSCLTTSHSIASAHLHLPEL